MARAKDETTRHRVVLLVVSGLRAARRPTARDLGIALGLTPSQLRRRLRQESNVTVRQAISIGCLDYAAGLLHESIKVEAALRLAGFRHYSSFCRQVRLRFGCLPSEFAERDRVDVGR
jgi:AraC-like DNA-binding protein